MKIIDDVLFIEFNELVEVGISGNTIRNANLRNSPSWHIINDPQDKRRLLIGYEKLSKHNKEKVINRFGNPYDFIAKEPIRKLVTLDIEAEQFFRDRNLPPEHQTKYTKAASWLNMMVKLNDDKKFIKNELKLTLAEFWSNVCDIITSDKIDLPTSYQRLRQKMDEYKQKKYESLIDWRFGNKLSAKIGKGTEGFDPELAEKQRAFILKAASMHNNFDAMQIARAVNLIFKKQQWPTISHTTVYNLIRENTHLITAGRRGKREYNSTIAMQVKRTAPQFPLQYLTLDGWTVELLYQDDKGYNNRLVVVVVLDACCKYPLGYAIGDRESAALIKQANINACIHIRELFGANYQPRQVQSDNFGLKSLTPFYSAMAHLHTPAAVGNAKAKIIEPYFMYLNKNYCQIQPNWSGFNIDSKKGNQPNREFLDKIKSTFPDRAGVEKQIHIIMARERETKIEEYFSKWELLPIEERREMKREDVLMIYGQPTGYTNTITGQGLLPTINGTQLTYDTFDPKFRALQHLSWQVVYDDADLSSILAISEDNKHRFVLHQKRALPMAIHDMGQEDHNYLSEVKTFNTSRANEVMEMYARNDELVHEVMQSTPLALDDYNEAALKLMFTYSGQQKERLQDAKGLKKIQQQEEKREQQENINASDNWLQLQQDYLKSKTDINQYLD